MGGVLIGGLMIAVDAELAEVLAVVGRDHHAGLVTQTHVLQ